MEAPAASSVAPQPAPRWWLWAALLLQAEVLGALITATVFVLRSPGAVSPAPVLFGLLAASLLFPLGNAIERGSHPAALILAVMYALRAFQALASPFETLVKMAPMLVLEGFVFGRAIVLMTKHKDGTRPDEANRIWQWIRFVLPLIATAVLFSRFNQFTISMASRLSTEMWMEKTHGIARAALSLALFFVLAYRMPQRVLQAFGRARPRVSLRGATSALPIPKWPRLAWLDFAIGLCTLWGSVWVLSWFFDAASQPGAMLVPSVIIVPLMAVIYLPLGVVWLVIGVAEIKQKKWTQNARIAAAVPLLLLLIMVGPALLHSLPLIVKSLLGKFGLI